MDIITKVWSDWKTESEIGHGAFGRVYKVKREEFGAISYAAVKVIEIPQDESEVKELKNTGMDSASIKMFYEETVKGLVNEIQILTNLKTAGNIVSIEDYKIIPHENGIGWTVFIRMELLESLSTYLERQQKVSEKEVAQLGIDLCAALECCEMNGIIHRDIKPDNIFRNPYGTFKLGDFGVSRQLESTRSNMSQKGTTMYMAPEVYRGNRVYNRTVDIYSLGITLYKLLNSGRPPFCPAAPAPLRPNDMLDSMERRMSGEAIPAPKGVNAELAKIILKACAYESKDRYQYAKDMKAALVDWYMNTASDEQITNEANSFGHQATGTSFMFNTTGTMNGTMTSDKTWSANKQQGFMFSDTATIGMPKPAPKPEPPKPAPSPKPTSSMAPPKSAPAQSKPVVTPPPKPVPKPVASKKVKEPKVKNKEISKPEVWIWVIRIAALCGYGFTVIRNWHSVEPGAIVMPILAVVIIFCDRFKGSDGYKVFNLFVGGLVWSSGSILILFLLGLADTSPILIVAPMIIIFIIHGVLIHKVEKR